MPRARNSVAHRRKVHRILKRAKGYYSRRRTTLRAARDGVERSEERSRIGRRQRKRQLRRLWITRIGAAARERGMSYSMLMRGLKEARVTVDRKIISEIAVSDGAAFDRLVELAKAKVG
jgi:large subunit ribosomal protein L20